MNRKLSLLCFLGVLSLACSKRVRIIGGNIAWTKQFPYQISIQPEGYGHGCGGGIIGERFVLTAGHCVASATRFTNLLVNVIVDTTDASHPEWGRKVPVEKIYVLKSFDASLANDIAVLKLKEDIGLRKRRLRKLSLPRRNLTYAGKMAKISGYGTNHIEVSVDPETGYKSEDNPTTDYKLRYLDTRIVSHAECEKTNGPIRDTIICGHGVQRYINGQLEGICSGDSGGPLVYINTIIGVVSTSPVGCEESVLAATYTRVSSYIDFIDKVMNGIETDEMRIHTVPWDQ